MFSNFIQAQLPCWAQVQPGKEDEALLVSVERVARRNLLDHVLSWINHPEYVSVEVVRDGETFRLEASYRSTDYDAQVTVGGEGLKYIKPWGESRKPQPPLYGVKMTLPNYGGGVEVLLTNEQKDPPAYDILSWGRGGTMYDGAVFENIPGEIAWNEGETQKEFYERAHNESCVRVGVGPKS